MEVTVKAFGVTARCRFDAGAYSGEVMRDMFARACDGLQRGLAITADYVDDDQADTEGE